MVSLVSITPDTLDALTIVLDDVFDDPIMPEALAAFVAQPNHRLIVALDGETVVGQIRGMILYQPDDNPQLYIDNLGVTPFYQRQGIATKLVIAMIDWGNSQNVAAHWVLTESENTPARALYTKLGLAQRSVQLFET